jgi:hypothetical protein
MQFFVKRSNFKVIDVCVYPKSSIESGNVCLWSYCCSCLRQFHLLYRFISKLDKTLMKKCFFSFCFLLVFGTNQFMFFFFCLV